MESFEQQLARIIRNREQVSQEVFAAVSLQLSNKIITRTPVDTGRARGNWNASVNRYTGSTGDGSESQALARTANKAGGLELGNTFYLTNGLPYIRALEYGSSGQASSGMVRVTVEEFQQAVNEAVNNAQ